MRKELLMKLNLRMEEVLRDVNKLLSLGEETPKLEPSSEDSEEILESLRKALEDFDGEAINYFEDHEAFFRQHLGSDFDDCRNSISQFEFEQALEYLSTDIKRMAS